MRFACGNKLDAGVVFLALTLTSGCRCGAPVAVHDAGQPDAVSTQRAPLTLEPGARLVFFRAVDKESGQVFLVTPDGGPERALTSGPATHYPAFAFPSGEALLVLSSEGEEESARETMQVLSLDSGEARQIGPVSSRTRSPVLSPDGRWIAFESGVKGFSDIYLVAEDGRQGRRLTRAPEGSFEPSFSPDGRSLVYASSRTGDPELYRAPLDGGEAERLTTVAAEDISPHWSPAGDWIAFVSTRDAWDRIYLMRPDGTQPAPLVPEGLPPAAAGGQVEGAPETIERDLRWSPDGSRLVFTGRRKGERSRLWVMELASRQLRALTDARSNDEFPAWSPDGKLIAFISDRAGNPDVYVMSAEGGTPLRMTRSPEAEALPVWLPQAAPSPSKAPKRSDARQ